MANMSYTRFKNTLGDLQDCYDNWTDPSELSEVERKAQAELLCLCSEIHLDFGEGDDG